MLQAVIRAKLQPTITAQVSAQIAASGRGNIRSAQVQQIVVLDKAAYEALPEHPADTLYFIRG